MPWRDSPEICNAVREAAGLLWGIHATEVARQEAHMHARIAKYTFSGDAQELGRIAEDGLMPIFQAQPGFKAYSVVASDDKIISFSAWESAEAAEAANAAAAGWVAENMGDKIELENTRVGEILFSSTLGVSTKAGATA
jgi:heme-degrading monooxygenase HmoA